MKLVFSFLACVLLPLFAMAKSPDENYLPFVRVDKVIRNCFLQDPNEKLFIQPLDGGYYHASHFSLTFKDKNYRLKLFSFKEHEGSVKLQLFLMQQAAMLGIAPSVHYVSIDARAIITDEPGNYSLTEKVVQAPVSIKKLARMVKKMH